MPEKFTSRKFILAGIVLAAVIVMRWFNRVGDNTFRDLVITILGIYSGANVASKFVQKG